ncbi:MAG: hypothetical protein PHR68_02880 [Candidatus Gracilibacteria bacterium]|nr:hypothetical protein [Candidatus Gracilibacteria bacterium]
MPEIKEIGWSNLDELDNLTNTIEKLSQNYESLLKGDFNHKKVQERIDDIKIGVLSILGPGKEEIKKDIEKLYEDILNLGDLINIQKDKILILEINLKEKPNTNKIKDIDNKLEQISQNHKDVLNGNLDDKVVQNRLDNIKTGLFESPTKEEMKIHLKKLYEKVLDLGEIVKLKNEKILFLEIQLEIQEGRINSRGPFTNYVMIRGKKYDL